VYRRVLLLALLTVSPARGAEPGPILRLGTAAGANDFRILALAFSPDGRTLAAGDADRTHYLTLWDLSSGKARHRMKSVTAFPPIAQFLAFSPDGKLLASGGVLGRVHLWDVARGKEVRELPYSGTVRVVVFSPGARSLAWGGSPATSATRGLSCFDLRQGKEIPPPRGMDHCDALAVAPDGKSFRAFCRSYLHALSWSVADGKPAGVKWRQDEGAAVIAVSADGRALASVAVKEPSLEADEVKLWDAETGKLLRRIATDQWAGHKNLFPVGAPWGDVRLAVSPDGRTVLTTGPDGSVRLWETASGRERGRFRAHRGRIDAAAFSADGRAFAVAGADTTVWVWDVLGRSPAERKAGGRFGAAALAAAWDDLANANAHTAYKAVWGLAESPERSVPFLKARLATAPGGCAFHPRVAQLVRDLGAESFAVRERATEELGALGGVAAPALEAALTGKPEPEVKRRAERLLAGIKADAPGQLRQVRAVEVLEHASTPEARKALAELAAGHPAAPVTREAKVALGRLERR
jgi:WD40 repeat protein